MRSKVLLIIVGIVVALAIMVPAAQGSLNPNYGYRWETAYVQWTGHVQIQASYNDNGQHAKYGWHRFWRQAGPALDTGPMPTSEATSTYDNQIRSREDSVFDSLLWGEEYTTHWQYDIVYF